MSSDKIPLAGVIGSPVSHSKSPNLHSHWLKTYGVRGHYIPMDVSPDSLKEVLKIMPEMGFVGTNVTIPHKERVLNLAELVTDRATLIGAANTLIFRPDGKIHADNTDGYGFITNLRENTADWDPKSGPAAILGAGGAARAVITSLLDAGTPEIRVSNRTKIRAEALKADFGNRLTVVDWVQAGNMFDDAKTVVNTTSLGMVGNPPLRVPLDGLRPKTLVTDLVYAPLKTDFLVEAEQQGCTIVDGLGMLLHQAVPGFERWFGVRPEVNFDARSAALQ